MPASYLVDTSAWIEYLGGTDTGREVRRLVREGAWTHPLVIAETASKIAREGRDLEEAFASFRALSILPCWDSPLDWRETGAFHAEHRRTVPGFSLADALLYTAARKAGLVLLTKDREFKDLPGVKLLESGRYR